MGFKLFFKTSGVGEGRPFYSLGPATAKAQSPHCLGLDLKRLRSSWSANLCALAIKSSDR